MHEEDIDGLGSNHQQRNVVLLQYHYLPFLLQNGETLLRDWHLQIWKGEVKDAQI
jgi:hypothetical protein